jgi:hypothetical protein
MSLILLIEPAPRTFTVTTKARRFALFLIIVLPRAVIRAFLLDVVSLICHCDYRAIASILTPCRRHLKPR